MGRIAQGGDDSAGALLVLLVLRTFAVEHGEGIVVELSTQEVGMLLTIEVAHLGLWHAELLRVSMATIRRVVSEMPELLHAFEQSESEETLRLRARALPPRTAIAARMTPVALPSLDLLLAAGLLTGPSPTRGDPS